VDFVKTTGQAEGTTARYAAQRKQEMRCIRREKFPGLTVFLNKCLGALQPFKKRCKAARLHAQDCG